jgi:beta-galactosidase
MCYDLCDLIHTEGAEVIAQYKNDFYKGRPALTVNSFGKGKAYYIASRNSDIFDETFYDALINKIGIKKNIEAKLPKGVTAQLRTDGENEYIFLMNFSETEQIIHLDNQEYIDMLTKEVIKEPIKLSIYGMRILLKKSNSIV